MTKARDLASLTNITTKTGSTGSSLLPSGTTAQRDGTPASGMLRFNSSDVAFEGYNGSAWGSIGGSGSGGGATGGGSDEVFYENDKTITTTYTVASNKNAMSTGPLTVNNGAIVTIPSGSRYVVI